jgi:hypothetical protein
MMANHFNAIAFVTLTIVALGIFIAVWFLHHRGEKAALKTQKKCLARSLNPPNYETKSGSLRSSGQTLGVEV